ncbi:MAG: FAD-dependent oxidoreductase [Candidatus Lokiarchaeota archaeon]|nr:FAD-dependent oxidoreductase [Candidatus Lokiarchaeota archaeon]MBD3338717.1 FAD-dependent oxidoreductase [Candidatus Lokiarchaeota archaeon]
MPIMAETDILVVGGGPAGLSAALAAAREGVNTMLIERYGCFGGNITQSMVGTIAWYRYPGTVEAGGIGLEFESRAKQMGGSINTFNKEILKTEMGKFLEQKGLLVQGEPTYEILDTEMFKYVADTLIQEANIVSLLHCTVVNVLKDDNTIIGVITESKSGRQAILAKRIIDATGDADVAYFAGAPYRKDPKNKLQRVTLNFSCSGVDLKKFFQYYLKKVQEKPDFLAYLRISRELFFIDEMACLLEPIDDIKKGIEIPKNVNINSFWSHYAEAGIINSFNGIHMDGIDCTDVWDLTKAEIEGRKRIIRAIKELKKHIPGFNKARLKNIGSSLGTRESRKIIGEYNLTEHDMKNQARFEDTIGICPEFIDGFGIVALPITGRYFHVPYGIILPHKVENLLVAGRCVAGDKLSHAATRQMVCCTITGQGAGVAAAVSLKTNVSCRQVNILKVQESLKKQGVRIE